MGPERHAEPQASIEIYQQIERLLLDAPIMTDIFGTFQKVEMLCDNALLVAADIFEASGLDAPDSVEIGLYTELPVQKGEATMTPSVESALLAVTAEGVRTIYSLWVEETGNVELTKIIEAASASAPIHADDGYNSLCRSVEAHAFERLCEIDKVSVSESRALLTLLTKLTSPHN